MWDDWNAIEAAQVKADRPTKKRQKPPEGFVVERSQTTAIEPYTPPQEPYVPNRDEKRDLWMEAQEKTHDLRGVLRILQMSLARRRDE